MAEQRTAVVALEPDQKADLIRRLKTARGHLDAILTMIDQDTYCLEVLRQLSAVRSALDRIGRIELRHHLQHCFLEAVRSGEEEPAVLDLMETLEYDKNVV
ncbi:MAG: metal-sensitive transcriptional regulator [Vulcanimicrobiaceae bacterium]